MSGAPPHDAALDALQTTVVVPTIGRPSLQVLLTRLSEAAGPRAARVVVVDDRADSAAAGPLQVEAHDLTVEIVSGGGRGPAHARNVGWRHASTPWVSFLDDDVEVSATWWADLAEDLRLGDDADGIHLDGTQGVIDVPLPTDRRPTDWERGTAGLAEALWITADMTYRRSMLLRVGGFDERFPRAFREDADLALRVEAAGGRLCAGRRRTTHPVRPVDDWVSLRVQKGNADDPLMSRLHGRDWYERAGAIRGRRTGHTLITAAGLGALALAGTGRRRAALLAGAAWAVGTAELAWARIAPGPRDRDEVRRMALTSIAMPPIAVVHTARGWWQHREAGPWRGVPDLVLLDRDGTLIHDVPYNGDPGLVRPVAGARAALDLLRAEGVRLGVVTNQSGIGSGRITREQADAVNAEVERLLGPFETWQVCPHASDAGCACRKPAPGMVKAACSELELPAERCAVIGDIGSDVDAAQAAGAVGVLVPTGSTRPQEVAAAKHVHASLPDAVDALLRGQW